MIELIKRLFCPFRKKCKAHNITPPVYLDTVEDKGNLFVVRLKGDINMEVLGSNRERMTQVIEAMGLYTKNVLVDFQKVTHTDSATVAALLGRLLDIQQYKKRIAFFNIPESLQKMIEVLKVEHNFTIYANESVALHEFKGISI